MPAWPNLNLRLWKSSPRSESLSLSLSLSLSVCVYVCVCVCVHVCVYTHTQICGETSSWNTKRKVIDQFKESTLWPKWTTAGHSEQKLVNLINRLRIRRTEEAAKGNAAAAAALAAANGTAPPGGVISGVGAVGGVSAFESEVVVHLKNICGEANLWNTKKKVIDQFKASVMWDSWITAGHNEQKLVNFINRLKIKHLEEGGGTHAGGGGVSSFEPQVVKELT